jgi:hypothetical protein
MFFNFDDPTASTPTSPAEVTQIARGQRLTAQKMEKFRVAAKK